MATHDKNGNEIMPGDVVTLDGADTLSYGGGPTSASLTATVLYLVNDDESVGVVVPYAVEQGASNMTVIRAADGRTLL